MNTQLKTLAILLVFTVAFMIDATAIAAKNYDAEKVLKRIYDLSEFPDSTQSAQTYSLNGTVEHAGLTGHFTTLYEKDRGYVNSVDLGRFGFSQGLDGTTGWESSSNEIVSELSLLNEEALVLTRIIESREYLSAQQSELNRICLGPGDFDGRGIYRFRFSQSEEIATDVFIDSLNGHVIAIRFDYDFIEIEIAFSDFREIGGLVFPFHSELTASLAQLNMTTQTISCEVNGVLPDSSFVRPVTRNASVIFPADADSLVTALEYYQGHLYFRMSVNGSEPLLFLFDSGSGGLVIDAFHVESLGLKPFGSSSGLGVAGSADFSFAIIAEMNLDGLLFKEQVASVLALEPDLRNALRDVVGIIGYDFLGRLIMAVDYDREQMTIFPPTKDVTSEATDISAIVPLEFYFNLPTVSARVNDQQGAFIVDVGSGFGPLLHEHFVHANSLEDLPKRQDFDDSGHIGGVGGSLPTQAVTIADFELGTLQFQNQPAWTILGGAGFSASKVIAGNIGNGFLDQFRVTFDYPHRRLILRDRIPN